MELSDSGCTEQRRLYVDCMRTIDALEKIRKKLTSRRADFLEKK